MRLASVADLGLLSIVVLIVLSWLSKIWNYLEEYPPWFLEYYKPSRYWLHHMVTSTSGGLPRPPALS